MRIKFIGFIPVLASLACTANVSTLQPAPTAESTSIPLVSAPPLEGMPNVIPTNISSTHILDFQNAWAVTGDANGHTSLYMSSDGGQTWNLQIK